MKVALAQAGFMTAFVPISSDMPELSWPDPVEHARIFVTETFPGDIDQAFDIACLNLEANPEQAHYWLSVAESICCWGNFLKRAQA